MSLARRSNCRRATTFRPASASRSGSGPNSRRWPALAKAWPVKVERIDDLGRARLARLRLGGHAIAAGVPDGLDGIGETAGLILQPGHVHVYADGERLEGRA